MSALRTVMAFWVAPLVVPFVFLLPLPGGDRSDHFSMASSLTALFLWSLYALPIAYLVELVLGIPAWKALKHHGIRSLPVFAAAGAIIGWLVNLIVQGVVGNLAREPLTALFNPSSNAYLVGCVLAASSSAVLFRVIVFSGPHSVKNSL